MSIIDVMTDAINEAVPNLGRVGVDDVMKEWDMMLQKMNYEMGGRGGGGRGEEGRRGRGGEGIYIYRLLRWIGYFCFELNVWVWRSFLGLIGSPKTGLFLTFWKVNRSDSRRTGRLSKRRFLFKIVGKNSKKCV